MSDPQHVHFVGIGGIHMSGLAEILLGDGVTVSGSDLTPSPLIERLRARGARIALEHQAGHVEGADLVVHTLAAQATNPELVAARQAGIPLITRAEMVARVAEGLTAVTVAGSHGKTTTAAMLTVILREAGLDPTYVLGGECSNLPAHAARGHGDLAVLEADEYGRAFHAYRPRVALITNVESDHLDYYGTAAALQEAFLDYATTLQPQGTLIVGAESPCAAAVAGRAQERRPDLVVRSFGLGPAFDWAAVAVQQDERRSEFLLRHKGEEPTPVPLGVPGEHNVRNALAATAAAAAVGVDLATAGQALAEFSGVRRRFQQLGETAGVVVLDDYAHHPTEIAATLATARTRFPGRRLVVLFQPHTYSRSRYLLEGFQRCFRGVARLYLASTYAAREEPQAGLSAQGLATRIEEPPAVYAGTLDEAAKTVSEALQPGDLLIVMGAGDIEQVGPQILARLEAS